MLAASPVAAPNALTGAYPDNTLVFGPDGITVYALKRGKKYGLPDPDTLVHTFQPLVGWDGPSVWAQVRSDPGAQAYIAQLPTRPWSEWSTPERDHVQVKAALERAVGAPGGVTRGQADAWVASDSWDVIGDRLEQLGLLHASAAAGGNSRWRWLLVAAIALAAVFFLRRRSA